MPLRSIALLLTILLHALLFHALVDGRHAVEKESPPRYSRLVLISLPPPKPAMPRPDSLPPDPAPRRVKASPLLLESPIFPVTRSMAENAPPTEPADIPSADPFETPAKVDIDKLIKQAAEAAREIGPAGDNQGYGRAANSMEAVLARAFTKVKLAVPPKWYEAARIELYSAPGARKPIYQVKTAFGTYCLFYPDRLTEGTGQPRIADCPRSFGR